MLQHQSDVKAYECGGVEPSRSIMDISRVGQKVQDVIYARMLHLEQMVDTDKVEGADRLTGREGKERQKVSAAQIPNLSPGNPAKCDALPDTDSTAPKSPSERSHTKKFMTLEELNRETAKLVYQPLSNDEIRLVIIHRSSDTDAIECTVVNISESLILEYEILSYVWGSQEDPNVILLNGKEWKVT
jgi:hypothetical protein